MHVNDPIGLPWTEGNTWQSVDVRDAWLPIITKLNKDLLKVDPDYRVFQVKEKFGGLRYYFEIHTDNLMARELMRDLVGQAELECRDAEV